MKIYNENLINDFHRDTYWTRLHVESDDGVKKSTILLCASHEYFWDLFKSRDFSEEQLTEWLNKRIEEWKNKGERILDTSVHRKVYATTIEGEKNGYEFLLKEILP